MYDDASNIKHDIDHVSYRLRYVTFDLLTLGPYWPVTHRQAIHNFLRHSVAHLSLDCFVSQILLVLYRKCHFGTYPLSFHPKFGDVPLELDRWAV